MSSSHKLVVSIYSNTETNLAMSGLAISAPRYNVVGELESTGPYFLLFKL